MVKRITIVLNDEDYEKWKSMKGSKSWYEFFNELVSQKEGECLSKKTVCDGLRSVCDSLSKLASGCKREEILLKLCSGVEERVYLIRAFALITNILEEKLDGVNRWLAILAKSLIIDLVNGDIESVKRELKEICSISIPSR